MWAVICHFFSGYTFEILRQLPVEEVVDIYAAAEWLSEEKRRLVK